MEHPPDPPAPNAVVYDPASDLHFPSEEARLFYLQGAKDALSSVAAKPAVAHRNRPPHGQCEHWEHSPHAAARGATQAGTRMARVRSSISRGCPPAFPCDIRDICHLCVIRTPARHPARKGA